MESSGMGMTDAQLHAHDTMRAFDAVASSYDRTNRENPILAHMRARAVAALCDHVPAGAAVLDLGCGPGTDHPALVAAGYRVTAIDASAEMVARARQRADLVDVPRRPTVLCRSLDEIGMCPPASFDAAFSNFGALNCAADLASIARHLGTVLRPGGVLVASVIGRHCPWEIAWHLGRGHVRRAFVRYRRGPVRVPLGEGTVWTRYMTPRTFRRIFVEAGFEAGPVVGLGVVAPPPYLEHLARRYPALIDRLLACDAVVGTWPIACETGDHFLIVMHRA
ncbi:MAG: class I SAM-dependent methyltransferase [Vicinamibacterales bacterium]